MFTIGVFTKNNLAALGLGIVDFTSSFVNVANENDLRLFYSAMEKSEGVLEIVWEYGGIRSVPVTSKKYYSWNGNDELELWA